MKQITAIIRSNMIDDVIFSLHQVENFPGATVSEVKAIANKSQSEQPSFDMPLLVKLEITCEDNQENTIVKAIKDTAHTGRAGDGKIVISTIEKMELI